MLKGAWPQGYAGKHIERCRDIICLAKVLATWNPKQRQVIGDALCVQMRGPPMLMFLKSVGEALVAKGLGALKGFVPFGNVVFDIGADAIDRYRKARKEAQLAAHAEALLKAEMKEVRAEAERIVREVAKGESEEIIDLAVAYLTQMPGTIRQSLKRGDDPTGTTFPVTLNLQDPVQLSSVLPRRLPTFRSGDPVPHAPQWRFVELLGAGGFGEVWLARHAHLNRLRAFKFCLDAASRRRLMAHEMAVVDRVMEASKAVTDADHGIVPLLDCHIADDSAWLAYEYIDGGDLAAWARANSLLAPPVRAANALSMVRDLAGVVGHFHAQTPPVVHRDLKPANVLLKKANGRWLIRVTDFGISHLGATGSTPSMSLGQTFRGAHTPTYASPQQKRGEPADSRDDVHALGIIALQLLLGDLNAERPSGNSWKKKVAGCDVSAVVLDLLARCWDDDPEERPRDASDLQTALTHKPSPSVRDTSVSAASSNASLRERQIRMQCEHCNKKLKFAPAMEGKSTTCPRCHKQIVLRPRRDDLVQALEEEQEDPGEYTPSDFAVVFEMSLDFTTSPVLRSHVIDSRAVLPMSLHMEWLAHAALHGNPGFVFHGFNEMRVTNGVMVTDDIFKTTIRATAGRATKSDNLVIVPVEMCGKRRDGMDVVHSRAEVVLTAALPKSPSPTLAPELQPYPYPLDEIYRDFLFHGPDMQGIEIVNGVAPDAIEGLVLPAPVPANWFSDPPCNYWIADPLILDASFQLMTLWCYDQHGAGSLPCFTGRYRQYRRTFPADPVGVALRITRDAGHFARADIEYLDQADGTIVAQIQDFECIIDPQLNQAFRRNQLPVLTGE